VERPRDNKRVVHATASIPAEFITLASRSDSGRDPDDQRIEVPVSAESSPFQFCRDGPVRRGCLAARRRLELAAMGENAPCLVIAIALPLCFEGLSRSISGRADPNVSALAKTIRAMRDNNSPG